jgi:hypothetical protein
VKRNLLILLLTFLLILFFPQSLFAAGFQLKTVGGLNVDGVTYDRLWYTNTNVIFTGTALQNATVTATTNGVAGTTIADASGNWSYTATLNQGDNTVSFESGGSTISFTLTIGEVPADVGGLAAAQTPTVGTTTPTLILIFLGILSLSSAIFLLRKNFLKA